MVEYQHLFHAKSLSWQNNLCTAVRLLLEFAAANHGSFASPRDLFETFSIRIRSGTFGATCSDPSGLYWLPKTPSRANRLIAMLTEFSEWTAKNYGVSALNPMRDATRAEQVIAAAAWAHKNNASFLGHTESQAKARALLRQTPWVPRHRESKSFGEQTPRFPEKDFLPLLVDGFVAHRNVQDPLLRLDLRCVLITLMQHGGALRLSECFHLWIHDVQEDTLDPSIALIRIGHPSHGLVREPNSNGGITETTRAIYLMQRGLRPRDRYVSKKRAGWKNPALTNNYLHVFWRAPVFGRLFMRCWKLYLFQRIEVGANHPWAFVNFKGNRGAPYKISRYHKAHNTAVKRIGLIPRKSEGTTPHGHRHRALFSLKALGLDSQILQKVAHHCSIESQSVYTEPEIIRMQQELYEVSARLNSEDIGSL